MKRLLVIGKWENFYWKSELRVTFPALFLIDSCLGFYRWKNLLKGVVLTRGLLLGAVVNGNQSKLLCRCVFVVWTAVRLKAPCLLLLCSKWSAAQHDPLARGISRNLYHGTVNNSASDLLVIPRNHEEPFRLSEHRGKWQREVFVVPGTQMLPAKHHTHFFQRNIFPGSL